MHYSLHNILYYSRFPIFFSQDLVENLCEKLGILPVNKALFGISLDEFGGRLYLPYIYCLTKDNVPKKKLYFRMQFKVDYTRMHETDPNAFSYFLLQVSLLSGVTFAVISKRLNTPGTG